MYLTEEEKTHRMARYSFRVERLLSSLAGDSFTNNPRWELTFSSATLNKVKVTLRTMVSRPVCLSVRHPFWANDQIFCFQAVCGFVDVGRPLWREEESVIYSCCCALPAQSFPGLSPTGLKIIFYFLKFETPPTWKDKVPVFISCRNKVDQLYLQVLGWSSGPRRPRVVWKLKLHQILRPTVSRPVLLGVGPLFGVHNQILNFL
jgi:hypothetical protein